MRTMQLVTPHSSGTLSKDNLISGQIFLGTKAVVTKRSHCTCHVQLCTARLCCCSVLDEIKCNLRKEQRIVMEMNFVTMHRILSPLQARHHATSP